MKQNAAPVPGVVLYEGAGSQPIEDSQRFAIAKSLLQKGYRVTRVAQDGVVRALQNDVLLVLGRFQDARAPHIEAEAGGVALHVRDIGDRNADGVAELVESTVEEIRAARPGGWKPWFPVIDYSRCTNCMQCLSFCLFDVYGVSDRKIQVQNQSNCKTDCPACSRVCPEVAILFPKYKLGPINGAEIDPEDLRREAMKVDISALLGGDIYSALRDRSARAKSRFSKERDEDRALKERQLCLTKLRKQLDIPEELLSSLPTMEQIQARTERALAGQAVGDSAPATSHDEPL